VKPLIALGWALAAANAGAATAYVTDELVLGVYAEQDQQGQRLTTLHSGASVEALATSGDFTQVRLSDGTTGWVKTMYLIAHEPAIVRIKRLEEELDRSRATEPALAAAAARSELEGLKRELAQKQSELDAARTLPTPGPAPKFSSLSVWAALIAAACGFGLGYATLARRVRRKFGGIRVY